jgi:hypothetical protein
MEARIPIIEYVIVLVLLMTVIPAMRCRVQRSFTGTTADV